MSYLNKVICIVIALILTLPTVADAQESYSPIPNKNKGQFYFYWGWNQSVYSNSDINFTGDDYNFTLHDVKAKDRQTKLSGTYFNPGTATIPQYNFRIGYFITEHLSISFGADHMKYVVTQNQTVNVSGEIHGAHTGFDAVYTDGNEEVQLTEDFLKFEHTDGLNYENIELRYHYRLADIKSFSIDLVEGFGFGALLPKTNSTLLGNERNDEFHLAGFGLGAIFAVNIAHKSGVFIQSEAKGGYINMPDMLTTKYSADRASQSFYFFQYNIVLGYKFGKVKQIKINE